MVTDRGCRRSTETSVRDALAGLTSASGSDRAGTTERARTDGPRGIVAALALAVVAVGMAAVLLPLFGRHNGPACPPITYAFAAEPPDHVRSELRAAIDEVSRRTGLHFLEADRDLASMTVTWWPDGLAAGRQGMGLDDHLPAPDAGMQHLAFGSAQWRAVSGGRELARATIDVDGSVPWPRGLDRGDALAAAFVHELGHVLGLDHSGEASSFMHRTTSPQRPRWHELELVALAAAGRQQGCELPSAAQ